MNDRTLAWASGILLLAVALGAFGAHGIQDRVDVQAYHNWTTAAQYQFYHGLALLGLASIDHKFLGRTLNVVRILFLLGILCFCGSLYLLAAREILDIQRFTNVLGPITPLGGLMFIAGWAIILFSAVKKR